MTPSPSSNSNVYIFGRGQRAARVLDWLRRRVGIEAREVAARFDFDGDDDAGAGTQDVPVLSLDDALRQLQAADHVIVATERFPEAVAELLSRGLGNVYNGLAAIEDESAGSRLLHAAGDYHIGPRAQSHPALGHDSFLRYSADAIDARSVPRYKRFIVNSMPKSGSMWMIAMLESVLGTEGLAQVQLSHVLDIEADWNRPQNHGAVVLVRDLRDVVVSWFHDLARFDARNGFARSRYPDIESFYDEYFIGQVFCNARYGNGDLERWLNLAGIYSFPVVRYEDLVACAPASLRKIMTFWKINVPDARLEEVGASHSFQSLQHTIAHRSGIAADMLRSGHMRRGQPGGWKDELSAEIASDIERRFAGYQRRLGYR